MYSQCANPNSVSDRFVDLWILCAGMEHFEAVSLTFYTEVDFQAIIFNVFIH